MKDTEHLKTLEKMADKRLMEITERLENKETPFNEPIMEYVDKLSHILKSLSCVIAMREDKEDGGESYRMVNTTEGAHSYGGNSYRASMGDDMSGARGRRNAPRDAMGRYSGRSYDDGGYSGAADELIEHLENAKAMAEDHEMKQKLQKIIREAKQM